MTETANAEQRAAWDGDSGHRRAADADRRDGVRLGAGVWIITATTP